MRSDWHDDQIMKHWIIAKNLCTYSIRILRQDKSLRDLGRMAVALRRLRLAWLIWPEIHDSRLPRGPLTVRLC
jgi:hypothetical protein